MCSLRYPFGTAVNEQVCWLANTPWFWHCFLALAHLEIFLFVLAPNGCLCLCDDSKVLNVTRGWPGDHDPKNASIFFTLHIGAQLFGILGACWNVSFYHSPVNPRFATVRITLHANWMAWCGRTWAVSRVTRYSLILVKCEPREELVTAASFIFSLLLQLRHWTQRRFVFKRFIDNLCISIRSCMYLFDRMCFTGVE